MAKYFGAGEGRCPSMSKQVTKVYTKAELTELKDAYKLTETVTDTVISVLLKISSEAIARKFLLDPDFVDVAFSTIKECVDEFYITNSEELVEILRKSGDTISLTIHAGCIRKGQNGHYWVIRDFSV